MTEKITKSKVLEFWANKWPEVARWLAKLQKKEQSALDFYHFCEWTRKTPTELLALKEKDAVVSPAPNVVEKLLDDFCSDATEGFTNSEKFNISIAVRSFFKWNYRELQKACGSVTLEKVKPYNELSKAGLRKLWNRALNPRDRALIPFVTSTGIAKETLSNLTWGHLEPEWETKDLPCINIGPELLKGHGRGKYKGVRQITFLTPEAKRELLNYKEWIQEKLGRNLTADDHIWLQTFKPYDSMSYDSFGQVIIDLSRNAGIPFTWHDGRRWVNTALEQIGITQNWAHKIRGRKVRGEEAPYSQPNINDLRDKFKEAVPHLEFTTEKPVVSLEMQERLEAIEKAMAVATPEQKELMHRYGLKFSREVKAKAERRKAKHGKTETNGGRLQQVVAEAELDGFLEDGWRVVTALQSGKIVLER